VVDDNANNQLVLLKMLETLGFEVALAASGEDGLEAAPRVRPDVIFMDLVLPGIAGFEAVSRLRQQPEFAETVIIAVSASVIGPQREHSLAAGCNDFLPKPLRLEALVEVLGQHLGLQWLDAPAPPVGADGISALPAALQVEASGQAAPLPPDAQELAALLDLARQGNLRAIRQRAAQLSAADPALQPFAARLDELARGYEERALLEFVRGYVEGSWMGRGDPPLSARATSGAILCQRLHHLARTVASTRRAGGVRRRFQPTPTAANRKAVCTGSAGFIRRRGRWYE
jgi:CheY-like chemotaxis protein